ncbi:MAG: DUF5670 family protein [Thermoanaerobaculia bacterium]
MSGIIWILVPLLLILWIVGFILYPVGGFLIHILLAAALLILIFGILLRLKKGGPPNVPPAG